ncbi:hypothetical protein [Frankia sp. ACN1ag]|uniref:hypothetical protein n=1 Tax=Frankia sp. ACN1ag TaxID=102891 RepID=UPI0006DCB56D|nr:hypothetical protein [Frankia sp. ACN1ag]KQC35025.1 hypothetical protein UK82_28570 [Frankia sp. ACN1ag]
MTVSEDAYGRLIALTMSLADKHDGAREFIEAGLPDDVRAALPKIEDEAWARISAADGGKFAAQRADEIDRARRRRR